jgi:glycine dehydrogenase subunit 1
MGYGGPHFGYLATKKAFVRQLPGRLVSETVDAEGRRGFILTLQAREQYIRRAKAKSNITTNAQLTALMGAMYLAALGPEGLKEVALRGVALAHRLYHLLLEVPGVEAFTPAPFFNEFALRLPKPPEAVRKALAARSLHAATPVPEEYGENLALFAATELHEEEDLLALRDALKEVLA